MPQEEFALRTGISVFSLRAIENGRRPMTAANSLTQIATVLKAYWNQRLGAWCTLGTTDPFQKTHAELLSAGLDPEDPYYDDLSLHYLIERLLDIFGATDRTQRLGLLTYLNSHLREIAEKSELLVNLEPTEPRWMHSSHPSVWGKPITKETVFWPYYLQTPEQSRADPGPHQDVGGIFDFRSRRSFKEEEYPAKTRAEAIAIGMAREHMASGDNRNFNRTYSGPKSKPAKEALKKGNQKSSPIGS